MVTDDTMVDVIGLALCIEPKRGKGVSFLVDNFDSELVSLSCNSVQQEDHCSVYKGDTVCGTELPVACISDRAHPLPEQLLNDPAKNYEKWSGGAVKFSQPIQGGLFNTQKQVNEFCQHKFGASFRVANIHDGVPAQGLIARGQTNGISQAWIDSNLEIYANCWATRPDYPEESEGG